MLAHKIKISSMLIFVGAVLSGDSMYELYSISTSLDVKSPLIGMMWYIQLAVGITALNMSLVAMSVERAALQLRSLIMEKNDV